MLIQAHAGADDRGFADNDAGAMVDEEARADRRAGVDVDPSTLVGELGNHARDDRRTQIVQLVRDTMMQAGDRAGVADEDFVGAARGGIAQKSGLDVAVDQPADIAERAGEQPHDRRGLIRGEGGARLHLPIAELTVDLAFQIGEGGGQLGGDEMILILRRNALLAQTAGIERFGEQRDNALDGFARGEDRRGALRLLPVAPGRPGAAQRAHRLVQRRAGGRGFER